MYGNSETRNNMSRFLSSAYWDLRRHRASGDPYRCFVNPTVTKKTKAIADDRQKYTLETELRCPEEGASAKKSTSASPSGSP